MKRRHWGGVLIALSLCAFLLRGTASAVFSDVAA